MFPSRESLFQGFGQESFPGSKELMYQEIVASGLPIEAQLLLKDAVRSGMLYQPVFVRGDTGYRYVLSGEFLLDPGLSADEIRLFIANYFDAVGTGATKVLEVGPNPGAGRVNLVYNGLGMPQAYVGLGNDFGSRVGELNMIGDVGGYGIPACISIPSCNAVTLSPGDEQSVYGKGIAILGGSGYTVQHLMPTGVELDRVVLTSTNFGAVPGIIAGVLDHLGPDGAIYYTPHHYYVNFDSLGTPLNTGILANYATLTHYEHYGSSAPIKIELTDDPQYRGYHTNLESQRLIALALGQIPGLKIQNIYYSADGLNTLAVDPRMVVPSTAYGISALSERLNERLGLENRMSTLTGLQMIITRQKENEQVEIPIMPERAKIRYVVVGEEDGLPVEIEEADSAIASVPVGGQEWRVGGLSFESFDVNFWLGFVMAMIAIGGVIKTRFGSRSKTAVGS